MNIFIAGKTFKSKSSLTNYLKFVLNNQDTQHLLTNTWLRHSMIITSKWLITGLFLLPLIYRENVLK